MYYLITAYSANPYLGSEDSIGWNWALQLEKNYKTGDRIILLTKRYNEVSTRKGLNEFGLQHIELQIVDVPYYLNWFREKHSMFHHMYYILWQHWAWKWVKKSGIKFDIIHHVTMCDYRITGEMYKMKDAKVIWGPVGGAQVTPKALRRYEKNQKLAAFRELVNKSCYINPFYKKALHKFDYIYCVNRETKKQVEQIKKHNVILLPELALKNDFKNLKIGERNNKVLNIVFVGKLLGKKGIAFLADALTLMPQNLPWKLQVYGDGPDKLLIESQIKNSRIASKIEMMGSRPYNQIAEAYHNADIFVLPSLRETSGNVLVEAMAHAIPIVAFDTSFCSLLKTKNCGIFVDTNQDLDGIKKDFVNAIIKLAYNNELRETLASNGYRYVNEELTWENKFEQVYRVFENDDEFLAEIVK